MFIISTEQADGSTRRQGLDSELATTIRGIIFGLAEQEEATAATEAASVPYWKSCPDSVIGHRAAAQALRKAAESIPLPFVFPS